MRHALVTARNAKGLTQEELAACVNVGRSSIAKYERGFSDIPGKVLIQLARVLEIPMEILYQKGQKDPILGVTQPANDAAKKHAVKRVARKAKSLQRQTAALVQDLEQLAESSRRAHGSRRPTGQKEKDCA